MIDLQFISGKMILITGLLTLYLAASQNARDRMWAGFWGVAGEPFWIMSAYPNKQYEIVFLAIIHAFMWARVFENNRRALG